jgi:hypothetical protein
MRIIRVREIQEFPDGNITKIYLMLMSEFLRNEYKIAHRHTLRPHPYKLWQIWYLIEVPIFYLVLLFSSPINKRVELTSPVMRAIKIIILILSFASSVLGILSYFKVDIL